MRGLWRYRIALPVLVLILGACASAPAMNPGTVEALHARVEILILPDENGFPA